MTANQAYSSDLTWLQLTTAQTNPHWWSRWL